MKQKTTRLRKRRSLHCWVGGNANLWTGSGTRSKYCHNHRSRWRCCSCRDPDTSQYNCSLNTVTRYLPDLIDPPDNICGAAIIHTHEYNSVQWHEMRTVEKIISANRLIVLIWLFRTHFAQKQWKKRSEETQTLRAGCSKAEPKIFAPPQTPFPGARDGQNLISWRWLNKSSLVRTDARNFELSEQGNTYIALRYVSELINLPGNTRGAIIRAASYTHRYPV